MVKFVSRLNKCTCTLIWVGAERRGASGEVSPVQVRG